MSNPQAILSNMYDQFYQHEDRCVGINVLISGYSEKNIDANMINDELKAAGFPNNVFVDSIAPSSCYLDLIRELAASGNNTRTNRAGKYKDLFPDYGVDFVKTIHDLNDKTKSRGGLGMIKHSIVKITHDKGRNRIVSDDTGELAIVTFTCRKVGDFQENPRVDVEVSDMASDGDIKFLDAIKQHFNYKLQGSYTVSEIIGKMNEHIQSIFMGIPLRRSGGIYFVPISHAARVIKYITAISVHAPINPIIIPIFNGSEFENTRQMIAQNIAEELVKDYSASIDKWQAEIDSATEGDKKFRKNTVMNSLIDLTAFRNRTKEIQETLGFDLERVQMLESELEDLLKRANRVASGD